MTAQSTMAETIAALKSSQSVAVPDPRLRGMMGLEKTSTFTQSGSPISGLTFYDLETGAKSLYPVLTPLRNETPRTSGRGGIEADWRAITGVNTTGVRIGVSIGNRGGQIAVTTQNFTASYKGFGLEGNADFEAQYAGMNFDDIRAIAARTTLESVMLGEEAMILGGNGGLVPLGQTPTPTTSTATTGGTLTNQTWSIICVALSLDGYLNASIAGGIQQSITRVNADGSSDTFGGGGAGKSVAASQATTGSTSTISATVNWTRGAMAYAWYWGLAGSEILGAITTINSVLITAAATGTQTAASLSASDFSTNSLVFNGLLYLALSSSSGSFVFTMANGTAGTGTPLTADGSGGIVEIDIVLKSMWDNFRLGPDTMWVNSQEALNISKKILQGGSGAAQRFVFNTVQDAIGGGIMVRTYLNRFSMAGGSTVDIRVHPNMPAGTILMTSRRIPYPLSNVTNVMQMRMRQDYYQIEWPLVSRKYQYGVYADGVLQHYFPPSMAVITNIANG